MKVINLFSGPGVGKSTAAASLFSLMKKYNYNVEYITEYAKELVYSKSFFKLKDQLYILAKQQHPLLRLRDQVDYVIMDSPLLLSNIYLDKSSAKFSVTAFNELTLSLFNSYNNINFYLLRNKDEIYQQEGRLHTLSEATSIDNDIKDMLISNKIDYKDIHVKPGIEHDILKYIIN